MNLKKSIAFLQKIVYTKKPHVHQQCAQIIQQLNEEIEKLLNQKQQHEQEIQILKVDKEYYYNEYQNNCFQKEGIRLQQENHHLNLLVKAHRKNNQQLTEKMVFYEKEFERLTSMNKQKDQIISRNEQKYLMLSLEKELLEKQWNKVVKAVKRKIQKIMKQNQKPENSKILLSQRRQSSQDNKQNREAYKFQSKHKKYSIYQTSESDSLKQRASNMVGFINNMLAVEELQQIFMQDTSNKKQNINSEQKIINPERNTLKQIQGNLECPFNVQFY